MEKHKESRLYATVPIDTVVPDPDQPRRTFDPEKLEELRRSMEQHGMDTPIRVKKRRDGTYTIVAGERRWRCAKALGWRKVDVEIISANRKALMSALIENMVREDLNPMDQAEAIDRLVREEGMSRDKISEGIGKDDNGYFVSSRLALLQLPDAMKEMVRKRELSETVALKFVRGAALLAGKRRADSGEIQKHFDTVCDRAHGKTKVTASIVEAHFDALGAEKKRRAPRKKETSASIIRGENGSPPHAEQPPVAPPRDEAAPRRSVLVEHLGAARIALDSVLGTDVKISKLRGFVESMSRAERKETVEEMEMIFARLHRLKDALKEKTNEKTVHA